MKNLIKTILRAIDEIFTNTNKDGISSNFYNEEIIDILEKCKILECILDNQYFSNLVYDLEINIENNVLKTVETLESIKLFLNYPSK